MNYYDLQMAIATYFGGHPHVGFDDLWPVGILIIGYIVHRFIGPKSDGVEDKR
jgi:hypothetical protein